MPPKPAFDLNDMGNRIIAAIVIALVFLGGWWLIARNSASSPSSTADTNGEVKATGTIEAGKPGTVLGPISEKAPTIAGSNESIEVEDQASGMSVKIKMANLVKIGWIAVRDEDGRTLGASRLEEGEHQNVEVPLLRATVGGKRYQVLIYVDDGDRSFDLHKDILVMRSDGSVAGTMFTSR